MYQVKKNKRESKSCFCNYSGYVCHAKSVPLRYYYKSFLQENRGKITEYFKQDPYHLPEKQMLLSLRLNLWADLFI